MDRAIWPPPLDERLLDFTGTLSALMGMIGTPVRAEIGTEGEHTRAVLSGELTATGDATGSYVSFLIGDGALTLKEPEFERGLYSLQRDERGGELSSVYVRTRAGATIVVAEDSLGP